MYGYRSVGSLTLALLAATFLTPPGLAQAECGALGPEFQVNSFTPDYQARPSVAMDSDGDFVVAWQSYIQEGGGYVGGYGIFAKRYDAAGVARAPEFQVNSFWPFWQDYPSVAMDADGDFVVAWQSDDGSPASLYAQRFNAAGVAQGPEFRVNSSTGYPQRFPSVAMDADGDFVVAWQRDDGDHWGVFARRFDAAGVAQGAEFLVNTHTNHAQEYPAVAMHADGNFVVAWLSLFQGIVARRFDATGAALGGEFQVSSSVASTSRGGPAVAMDADGDFVAAWNGIDGDGLGVFAQRFDAAGVAQGPEFQVNTFTTSWEFDPSIAMDADGDFVVAWESWNQDGSGHGIYAQRFNAAGVAQGSEFRVNNATSFDQATPSVAMDADGDFVVAWTDSDSSRPFAFTDVFAQRYQGGGPVAGDFTVDSRADILWRNTADGNTDLWQMHGFTKETTGSIGEVGTEWQVRGLSDFNADTISDVLWRNTSTGSAAIWLMDGFTKLDAGGIGAPSLGWEVVGTGDFDGDDYADILWRNVNNGAALIWQMDGLKKRASRGIGRVPLAWEVAGVGDFDADARADILWRNTTTGAAVVWLMDGFTKKSSGGIGAPSTDWQVEGLGDFTNDARSDILWRHRTSGSTVIWKMNGLVREDAAGIGTPPLVWRVEGLGDTDGDCQTDIIWRHTGADSTLIWRMDGFVKDAVGGIGAVPLDWEVQ